MERVEIGHSFAFDGGAVCSTEPGMEPSYTGGSTKPSYGEAGVRLSAFTRASSGAEPPRCRPASIAAVCGSQYTAEPAPERLYNRPSHRCPPACSTPVMFPTIDPISGLAMSWCRYATVTVTRVTPLRVSRRYAVTPLPKSTLPLRRSPVLAVRGWLYQPENSCALERVG
jgi:hypothetical protein